MDMYTFDLMNQRLSEAFGIQYIPMTYSEPTTVNGSTCHAFFKSKEFKLYMSERMNDPILKQKVSNEAKSLWQNEEYRKKVLPHITNLNQKDWLITEPTGNTLVCNNLAEYCREKNLSINKMRDVSKGRKRQYKGYIVKEK